MKENSGAMPFCGAPALEGGRTRLCFASVQVGMSDMQCISHGKEVRPWPG
jgi:hypothetical protein